MSDEVNRQVEIMHKGVVVGYVTEAINPPSAPTHKKAMRLSHFREMFTRDEMAAIYTAANSDVQVKMFLDDIAAMNAVSVKDQTIIDHVTYLRDEGVITADRATEILLGKPL